MRVHEPRHHEAAEPLASAKLARGADANDGAGLVEHDRAVRDGRRVSRHDPIGVDDAHDEGRAYYAGVVSQS